MPAYAVVNPTTGETIAEYPTMSDGEAAQAIATADETYRSWARQTTVAARSYAVSPSGCSSGSCRGTSPTTRWPGSLAPI